MGGLDTEIDDDTAEHRARGRALRARGRRAHVAPAQAVQRGVAPVRARRRPRARAVRLGPRRRPAPRARRRPLRRHDRRRGRRASPSRSSWRSTCPRASPASTVPRAVVVDRLAAVGCEVADADGRRPRRHRRRPGARPHRPGRPRRGGAPARRLRRHPADAAAGTRRLRAHRVPAARAAASAGPWPPPATSRCSPTRSSGEADLDALGLPADDDRRRLLAAGQPAVRRAAGPAHHAAARPARRRCAATSAAARPTSRCSRPARVFHLRAGQQPARRDRPAPAVGRRSSLARRARRARPACCPTSRCTSRVVLAGRRARPAGGARAQPATWADAVEAARVVAERRRRRARGPHGRAPPRRGTRAAAPSSCVDGARRRATPASCTRASARTLGLPDAHRAMELDLDAVIAAATPVVTAARHPHLPGREGGRRPRGRPAVAGGRRRRPHCVAGAGRAARVGAPVRRLHRHAGRRGPQVAGLRAALPCTRPHPRRSRRSAPRATPPWPPRRLRTGRSSAREGARHRRRPGGSAAALVDAPGRRWLGRRGRRP